MKQPVLYLMLGYPGAGKTTVAQLIAEQTDAVHIWADLERHKMFKRPNHSETESQKLYEYLNDLARKLLVAGKNVVFDTNFSHFRDRQLLREIAAGAGAFTELIWLTTPAEVARDRAVHAQVVRNGYDFSMTAAEFDRIAGHLEPPQEDEKVIKISGIRFDAEEVMRLFSK